MKHSMEAVSVAIHLNAGVGTYSPDELNPVKINAEFHDDPKIPYFVLHLGDSLVFMTLEQADELKLVLHNAIQQAVTL